MVWSVLSGGSSKALSRSAAKPPAPQDRLAGVGIIFIKAPDNSLFVKNLVEGSGAYNSGIQPGDCLMEVDGKNVYCKGIEFATELILGVEGSVVKLKFIRIEEKKKKRIPVVANLVREMRATQEPQFNINHENNRYSSGISTKKVFLECLQDEAMSPEKVARSHSALDVSAGKDLPPTLSPRSHSDFSETMQAEGSNRRPSDEAAGVGLGGMRAQGQGASDGPMAAGAKGSDEMWAEEEQAGGAEGQGAEDSQGAEGQGAEEVAAGAESQTKPKKVRKVKFRGKWYTEDEIAKMERVAKELKEDINQLETGPAAVQETLKAPEAEGQDTTMETSRSSESEGSKGSTPSPSNFEPPHVVKSHSFAIGQSRPSNRPKPLDSAKPNTLTAQEKEDERLTSDPKALGAAIKVVQGGTAQIIKASSLGGRKTIPLKISTGGSLSYGKGGKEGHVMWARAVTEIYNPKMSKKEFGDLNRKFLVMLEGEKVTAHSALGGEVRATEGKEPLEFIAHSEAEREEWVLGINMVLSMARKEAAERELKQREKILQEQAKAVQKVNSVFVTEPVNQMHMRREAAQAREANETKLRGLRAVSMPPGGRHSAIAATAQSAVSAEAEDLDPPKPAGKMWGGKLNAAVPAARQSVDPLRASKLPSLTPRQSAPVGQAAENRAERAAAWRQDQESKIVDDLKTAAAKWRQDDEAKPTTSTSEIPVSEGAKEPSPTDDIFESFMSSAVSPRSLPADSSSTDPPIQPTPTPPHHPSPHTTPSTFSTLPSGTPALDTPTIPEAPESQEASPQPSFAPIISPPPANAEYPTNAPFSATTGASALNTFQPSTPDTKTDSLLGAAQPSGLVVPQLKKADISPPGSEGSNDELPSLLSAVSTTGVTPRDTDLKLPEDVETEIKAKDPEHKETKEPDAKPKDLAEGKPKPSEIKQPETKGNQTDSTARDPEAKREAVAIKLSLSSKAKNQETKAAEDSLTDDNGPPTPAKPKKSTDGSAAPSGAKPRKPVPKPSEASEGPASQEVNWKQNLKKAPAKEVKEPEAPAPQSPRAFGFKSKEASPALSTKSNDSTEESPSGKGTAMVRSMVKAKLAKADTAGAGPSSSGPRKEEIKGKEKADLASIMAMRRKKQQEAEEQDDGYYF